MKSGLLIFLLFSLTYCLENKLLANFVSQPRVFASVLAKIEPGESKQTADDVQTLIDTGETERTKAQSDLDNAQNNLDLAKNVLDNAISKRTDKETELAVANGNAGDLTALKASQKTDMENKQLDRSNKDDHVPVTFDHMNSEISRIDSEKEFIEKIIAKVDTLSPGESEEEPNLALINTGFRRLLGNPSLLDIINNANPESIQKLIDLLQKLIDDGEVVRNTAIQEYNNAVAAAALAKEVQEAAEAAFAATSQNLVDEQEHIETAEGELSALQAAEGVANDDHNKATHIRDSFQTIFDAETSRIDGELQTYLDAISHLTKLEEIVSLLA